MWLHDDQAAIVATAPVLTALAMRVAPPVAADAFSGVCRKVIGNRPEPATWANSAGLVLQRWSRPGSHGDTSGPPRFESRTTFTFPFAEPLFQISRTWMWGINGHAGAPPASA